MNNGDAYFQRGLIFLDLGKLDQAVIDFTKAHEINPKDSRPVVNRGISYAWKRDEARAERDFEWVRAIDPSNQVLLRGEALISMNAGDMNAAVRQLTEVLSRYPGDTWSLAMRAQVYRRLGKDQEMRADLSELKRSNKNTPETGR